jgi:uncharacterized spore protein YtfJ
MALAATRLGVVDHLARTFGHKASAQTIFGSPVEKEGITVIPVGKVHYGLGGGSGSSDQQGEGSGGGGGMVVSPVGYIEITEGGSRFKRITSSFWAFQWIAGLTMSAWVLMHGLRAFRKN